MKPAARPRRNYLGLFLGTIEKVGNALPHPATLFALLAAAVVVLSAVVARLDLQVTHPARAS